jgi:hypothetical protein
LLVAAIRLRLLVHLRYDWGHRVVEPHVYGLTREGHELLRAFQVGGHSESGRRFGWKLFRVDEIENVHLPGDRAPARVQARRSRDQQDLRAALAALPTACLTAKSVQYCGKTSHRATWQADCRR